MILLIQWKQFNAYTLVCEKVPTEYTLAIAILVFVVLLGRYGYG